MPTYKKDVAAVTNIWSGHSFVGLKCLMLYSTLYLLSDSNSTLGSLPQCSVSTVKNDLCHFV